jgi:hypothetical protein
MVEAILRGTDLAGAHALLNALLSWVLVEASLASFDKIPFTCSYLPGKANLPYSAGLYFAIFATYSTAMSQIGYRALTGPRWHPLIWLVVADGIGFRLPMASTAAPRVLRPDRIRR